MTKIVHDYVVTKPYAAKVRKAALPKTWTYHENIQLHREWQIDGVDAKSLAARHHVKIPDLLKHIAQLRKDGYEFSPRKRGSKIVKAPGWERQDPRWTEDEIKALIVDWKNDVPTLEIALKVKRTPSAINKMVAKLNKQGIPVNRSPNFEAPKPKPRLFDIDNIKAFAENV